MSNEQGYSLRYTFIPECENKPYKRTDVTLDQGLCDALTVISIVRPSDGSYSQKVMSIDGETGTELTQKDLFKVWLTMGLMLADNDALQGWQKQTVDAMADLIRSIFKRKTIRE